MVAIAIDLGGTKIEGALIDGDFKVFEKMRVPTEAELGKDKILENLESVISRLKEKNGDVKGIGISMPGFVIDEKISFPGGSLECLDEFPLKKHLEKKFDLPIVIENDANCFALAEASQGAGKNSQVVVGVIWGSGIGGGIVSGGKIFSGSNGAAGEFGHIIVDSSRKDGVECGCGQVGCLESLASGRAIVEMYEKSGGEIKNPNPRDVYDSEEEVAKKIISDAVRYLSTGISNLVYVLNPDIIVLGGGVSKLPDEVYEKIEAEVKKNVISEMTQDLKIVRHGISDSSGVIGVAILVFEELGKNVSQKKSFFGFFGR